MNWKRLLLPSALILLLGLGAVAAQNITKAIQLSQDASGAFGVDANNNVYFPAHILSNTQRTPTVTGSTTQIYGTDNSGVITEGSSSTGVQVTFSTAYATPPACVVTSSGSATPVGVTATAGGFTISHGTATGLVVSYWCSARL